MDVPGDLRYTEDHEWVRLADGEGAVGITAYAADELGDVVFVELPKPGRRLKRREVFGVSANTGSLHSSIPAVPQSNSESGPPFSFWGRGVATTFRLQIAPPSAMNLSQLSAIHITLDCLGYAPQVAGLRVDITPSIDILADTPELEEALVG